MAEIYLDPQEFQSQIDAFASSSDCIKDLKYSLNEQNVRLSSVDRYLECVEELNKTLELFCRLMDQDIESMKLIKAKWMNTDSAIATKTLGEILFGQ